MPITYSLLSAPRLISTTVLFPFDLKATTTRFSSSDPPLAARAASVRGPLTDSALDESYQTLLSFSFSDSAASAESVGTTMYKVRGLNSPSSAVILWSSVSNSGPPIWTAPLIYAPGLSVQTASPTVTSTKLPSAIYLLMLWSRNLFNEVSKVSVSVLKKGQSKRLH
jgi:hypothetical protein